MTYSTANALAATGRTFRPVAFQAKGGEIRVKVGVSSSKVPLDGLKKMGIDPYEVPGFDFGAYRAAYGL